MSSAPSAAPRITDAAAALGEVDADRLAATVTELAADRYVGRRVGTAGGRAARTRWAPTACRHTAKPTPPR